MEDTPEGKDRTLLRGYKSEFLKTWAAFINYIKKEKLQYADQEKEIE